MSSKGRSRRSFLVDSVTSLNAAWVAANYHGILAAQEYVAQATQAGQLPRLTFFTDEQAAEIEAMTAQIIPTDETPGAREARCLYFIDRALSTFARSSQPACLQGLRELQAKTQQLYPDRGKFSALTFRAADQDAHRDREDAVLQHGPDAHHHRVLNPPGARRQLR